MRTVKHVSLWTLAILIAVVLACTAYDVSTNPRLQHYLVDAWLLQSPTSTFMSMACQKRIEEIEAAGIKDHGLVNPYDVNMRRIFAPQPADYTQDPFAAFDRRLHELRRQYGSDRAKAKAIGLDYSIEYDVEDGPYFGQWGLKHYAWERANEHWSDTPTALVAQFILNIASGFRDPWSWLILFSIPVYAVVFGPGRIRRGACALMATWFVTLGLSVAPVGYSQVSPLWQVFWVVLVSFVLMSPPYLRRAWELFGLGETETRIGISLLTVWFLGVGLTLLWDPMMILRRTMALQRWFEFGLAVLGPIVVAFIGLRLAQWAREASSVAGMVGSRGTRR